MESSRRRTRRGEGRPPVKPASTSSETYPPQSFDAARSRSMNMDNFFNDRQTDSSVATAPPSYSQSQQQQQQQQQQRMHHSFPATATKKASSHRGSSSSQALMSSYKTTSISKHYKLNDQILAAFHSLYERKTYKLAYAIGMQFVEVALLEIPQHGYFYAERHRQERLQNSYNAEHVTKLLAKLQEEDELKKEVTEADRIQLQRLSQLAKDQPRRDATTYEQERVAVAEDMANQAITGLTAFCGQVMDYHEMLAAICIPPPTPASTPLATRKTMSKSSSGQSNHRRPSDAELPPVKPPRRQPKLEEKQQYTTGRKKRNSARIDEGWTIVHDAKVEEEEEEKADSREHPPDQDYWVMEGTSELDLERALFLSGMMDVKEYPATCEVQPDSQTATAYNDGSSNSGIYPSPSVVSEAGMGSSSSSIGNRKQDGRRKKSNNSIDINSLQLCYAEDFDLLRQRSRIRISQAETYQGRTNGSINGCTVIAPLLCIHHLHNWSDQDGIDQGLLDVDIGRVIDTETPNILPQVRNQLGLTKDALIIPSDVHDFLIEKEVLSSQQFVTVCGGNILDYAHVAAFVVELVKVAKERKCGATFFFHEHVIAILPMRRPGDTLWFDWIDSLPTKTTLRKEDLGDEDFVPNAARIRCVDEEALQATILWYACSKFTDENRAYIDMYDWDEAHSDFDPRVFQAFLWAEMQ